MTHTHIPVMYRCASNYKSYGTIVLEGEITPEQIAELRSYMPENFGNPQFKPEQIGLQHHAYEEGGYSDDNDHPWHDAFLDEIHTGGPDCSGSHVEHPGTVQEFIDRVRAAHERHWEPYTATFDPAVETIEDLADLPTTGHLGDGDERDDNRLRATWAGHAVAAFADVVGDAGELDTTVSDLLCDLMHLCDALNINFDYMVARGLGHYTAEIRGEF